MKKKVIILALSLLLSLSGCHSNEEKEVSISPDSDTYEYESDLRSENSSDSESAPQTESLPFDEVTKPLETGSFGRQDDNVICSLYGNGHLYVYGEGKMRTRSLSIDYNLNKDTDHGKSQSYAVGASSGKGSISGNNSQPPLQKFYTNDKHITDIYIQDGVTDISIGAFAWCRDLASVEIPDSVTEIGDFSFFHCDSLESIVIPSSVTSIGDGTFICCYSLNDVELNDGIDRIGEAAFLECDSLNSIEIPESVKAIGEDAFASCRNLESIIFKGDKPSLAENIFYDVNAALYYPEDNESWKNVKDEISSGKWHDGEIRFIAYDPEKGIPDEGIPDEGIPDEDEPESETDSEEKKSSDSEKAPEPADWRSLYRDLLSDYAAQPGYHFGLLYIDEDDIPELVVTQTLVGNGSGTLYTIYDNEVKSVGGVSAYGTFYYKEKGNLMMGYSLRQGYNSTGFTSIIDGERQYVHTFSDNALSGESPIVYKMDDQEISKSEYDQKINELKSGMTTCEFGSLPDVNNSNITAKLG